jgi:integrase
VVSPKRSFFGEMSNGRRISALWSIGGDGSPTRVTALSQRFHYAMTKAGVDLHFHPLRHGNATLSLSAGIDLKVTSQRLGHSAVGITGNLYTHVADELDRQAAQKLDDLLAPIAERR